MYSTLNTYLMLICIKCIFYVVNTYESVYETPVLIELANSERYEEAVLSQSLAVACPFHIHLMDTNENSDQKLVHLPK